MNNWYDDEMQKRFITIFKNLFWHEKFQETYLSPLASLSETRGEQLFLRQLLSTENIQ